MNLNTFLLRYNKKNYKDHNMHEMISTFTLITTYTNKHNYNYVTGKSASVFLVLRVLLPVELSLHLDHCFPHYYGTRSQTAGED